MKSGTSGAKDSLTCPCAATLLTDVAGELDRMRTLLELDLDRRTGRSRPDPAKDAREASKRGPDGENTAEPARPNIEAICTLRITLEDLENALPNL